MDQMSAVEMVPHLPNKPYQWASSTLKHHECCFTSPGCSLPAAGLMLISQSPGRAKENSLGGTGVTLPLVTSWLVRESTELEQSPTAVSPNWTREWDSSKGGWTPVPRQDSRKSLVEKKKLFRYTVALDLTMWTLTGITFWCLIYYFPFMPMRQ